jgi:hypothetical protein
MTGSQRIQAIVDGQAMKLKEAEEWRVQAQKEKTTL